MGVDMGVVEEVRVSVAFAPTGDVPAEEVYVLEVRRAAPATREWDERRYVERLGGVLPAATPPPYTFAVSRRRCTWEAPEGRCDVALLVVSTADAGSREAVATAFRSILDLEQAGGSAPASRSEAIAVARRVAAVVWADTDAAGLTVTEEEHRPAQQRWAIGLVGPDGTRYQVDVGLVDGNPATVRARRTAPAEVVDSIGTW